MGMTCNAAPQPIARFTELAVIAGGIESAADQSPSLCDPSIAGVEHVSSPLSTRSLFGSHCILLEFYLPSPRPSRSQTVCAPRPSELDEGSAPLTVAALSTSLAAFSLGALRYCNAHEPGLLPFYLYLHSIAEQATAAATGGGSPAGVDELKLLARFYEVFPWRLGGARPQDEALEPAIHPVAVEQWWLRARQS